MILWCPAQCGISADAFRKFEKAGAIPFIASACKECKQLGDRVTALEAKVASGSSAINEDVLGKLVEAVLSKLLPQLTEYVQEATEKQSKRLSLVMVGLKDEKDEAVDTEVVHTMCNKLSIPTSDIKEVFRSGNEPTQPDRSRILKIKFKGSSSRRKFLTGFRDARDSVRNCADAFVRPDLTSKERQVDYELRQELRRLKNLGKNVKIMRGEIIYLDKSPTPSSPISNIGGSPTLNT